MSDDVPDRADERGRPVHLDDSPYHAGERALQARAGVRERAEQGGRKMIREFMPEQHRAFFAELPFVLAGSLDGRGQPWASVLWGPPGFVRSPDARTLTVRARPVAGDPLGSALAPGRSLGLLGIQLETRRRNRANGRITAVTSEGFTVRVEQSFGNCPKYINARTPTPRDASPSPPSPEGALLSPRARDLIERADTLFLASAPSARAHVIDAREHPDVSHRGGKPGFVRVRAEQGATLLSLPEFPGNNAFNTLGNLAQYPRAGLLFPDFVEGDLLALTGESEIVWEGPELEHFAGAQRLLHIRVREGLYFERALPFRWSHVEPAGQLVKTGAW